MAGSTTKPQLRLQSSWDDPKQSSTGTDKMASLLQHQTHPLQHAAWSGAPDRTTLPNVPTPEQQPGPVPSVAMKRDSKRSSLQQEQTLSEREHDRALEHKTILPHVVPDKKDDVDPKLETPPLSAPPIAPAATVSVATQTEPPGVHSQRKKTDRKQKEFLTETWTCDVCDTSNDSLRQQCQLCFNTNPLKKASTADAKQAHGEEKPWTLRVLSQIITDFDTPITEAADAISAVGDGSLFIRNREDLVNLTSVFDASEIIRLSHSKNLQGDDNEMYAYLRAAAFFQLASESQWTYRTELQDASSQFTQAALRAYARLGLESKRSLALEKKHSQDTCIDLAISTHNTLFLTDARVQRVLQRWWTPPQLKPPLFSRDVLCMLATGQLAPVFASASFKFWVQAICYLAFLLLFTVLLYAQVAITEPNIRPIEIAVYYFVGCQILEEGQQFAANSRQYLRDRWNASDWLRILVMVTAAACRISRSSDPQAELVYSSAMAVSAILAWTRPIAFLVLHETTGPMLYAIRQLATTIVLFTGIFGCFLVGSALGLNFLLAPEQSAVQDFATFGQVFLSLFEVSLGDFLYDNLLPLTSERLVLAQVLLSFNLVFGFMLLLNLLVSLMSFVFGLLTDNIDQEYRAVLASATRSFDLGPAVLPPPFNAIVVFLLGLRSAFKCCLCCCALRGCTSQFICAHCNQRLDSRHEKTCEREPREKTSQEFCSTWLSSGLLLVLWLIASPVGFLVRACMARSTDDHKPGLCAEINSVIKDRLKDAGDRGKILGRNDAHGCGSRCKIIRPGARHQVKPHTNASVNASVEEPLKQAHKQNVTMRPLPAGATQTQLQTSVLDTGERASIIAPLEVERAAQQSGDRQPLAKVDVRVVDSHSPSVPTS